MKILGIDPGTRATGYCVLQVKDRQLSVLDLGCIRPPATKLLSERYGIIHEGVLYLIESFRPDQIAIETPFVNKNMQSALKLGACLASVMLAANKSNISIYGYPPREVKQSVCGRGGASKEEVAQASIRHVRIQSEKVPLDALDALAIAITHFRYPSPRAGAQHAKIL